MVVLSQQLSVTMIINKNLIITMWLLPLAVVFSAETVLQKNAKVSATKIEEVTRNFDPVKYSQGQRLFQINCAKCHGKQGEGAKDWRKPDSNGKNLPPPLNGTGHTWHHPRKALISTIKNGTGKIGGNMPAWKDQLGDKDIDAILTWITAQWPDEIYASWYNRSHQNQ
jgi:mono/diheme cytochrome c family protein